MLVSGVGIKCNRTSQIQWTFNDRDNAITIAHHGNDALLVSHSLHWYFPALFSCEPILEGPCL